MATALDLITGSLQTIQAISEIETPSAESSDFALTALNNMLDQWSLEDLMIFSETTEQFSLVSGTSSYTIGPTGDFVTTRPIEILAAQLRYTSGTSQIDKDLNVGSNDSYQQVIQKTTNPTLPEFVGYNPTITNGTLLIWPTPSAGLSLRLTSNKLFSSFLLTDTVTLPIGYAEAIQYNLAVRLAIAWGKAVSPDIRDMAETTKYNLMRKNKKNDVMGFDNALLSSPMGTYNVYSDGAR